MTLDVRNSTHHATVATLPLADKDNRSLLAVIAKWSFEIAANGQVTPLEKDDVAIDLVDTFHGEDPSKSSILRPSQLFEEKPGTDVVLLGHAHPSPKPATYVDVSLRVGPIKKTVRAHGLRVWQWSTFGGLTAGPARPVREPIPLVYELAWGGMDMSDPEKPLGEPRNYAGRGVTRDPKSLVDRAAAQLEYPDKPIGGRSSVPAAFNPIHRHWQPRASFAGTYDEAWMNTRMPLLPSDFDPRFNVCVPPDQWSETPLRTDEPFEILGATPESVWRFQLPRIAPGISSIGGKAGVGVRVEHRTHLDTILVDADRRRVELTFRASIPLPRKYEMLDRVLVFEKQVV
jgi:hypothetical protein